MKGLALRPVGASQTSTRATMHPSVRGEGGSDAAHFFRLPGARFFVLALAFDSPSTTPFDVAVGTGARPSVRVPVYVRADICNLVDARYYLPYAHWFGELGRSGDVAADTPGHSEMSLLAWSGDALRQRSASTEIIPWQIGDGFVLHPGRGFETSSLTS